MYNIQFSYMHEALIQQWITGKETKKCFVKKVQQNSLKITIYCFEILKNKFGGCAAQTNFNTMGGNNPKTTLLHTCVLFWFCVLPVFLFSKQRNFRWKMKNSNKFNILELYSGIGGFHFAIKSIKFLFLKYFLT